MKLEGLGTRLCLYHGGSCDVVLTVLTSVGTPLVEVLLAVRQSPCLVVGFRKGGVAYSTPGAY